ncbi:SKP1-like protein 7 [Carex rostrata]
MSTKLPEDMCFLATSNGEEFMVTEMFFLLTSDGEECLVMEAIATMSPAICNVIKDGNPDANIELPNITFDILRMVYEYCQIHVFKKKMTKPCKTPDGSPIIMTEKEIENWDKEFVNRDSRLTTLFRLWMAAFDLDIPQLANLAEKKIDEELRIAGDKLFSYVDTC